MSTEDITHPPVVPPIAETAVPRAARPSRSAVALALQARALSHADFRAAATAVCTELRLRLACERVSIGFQRQGRVRVAVVSDAAEVSGQQNIVRAIAAAMTEAIEQAHLIVHPLPRGNAPAASLAHAELSHLNGHAAICTVPISAQQRALGAIVLERRDGFDARAIELAGDAAAFVGPLLELQHRLDQPVGARLVDAVTPRAGHAARLRTRHIGAAALALGLLAAALWPTTWRVVAPARVEAAGQRIIAAPVDGFVQSATLRPGERVAQGQVLATLEDRELALEQQKWLAEAAQLDKKYREALTQDDAASIVLAQSKLEQARVNLDLVQHQLARTRIVAPFDGVLVAGDLSQSAGMPVKRGQELMTVAPAQSFRIVAEVDEQDVAVLRDGQRVSVLFAALSGEPVRAAVTRVAPVATALDGRNVFEVDARLDDAPGLLRAGQRGVARIDIEPRSFGWICWHRASQYLQRMLWRVLG